MIPYSVVQDKIIIDSHSVMTTDGKEIAINPSNLFNSFADGGEFGAGGKIAPIVNYVVNLYFGGKSKMVGATTLDEAKKLQLPKKTQS